jgi:hypothetical protein
MFPSANAGWLIPPRAESASVQASILLVLFISVSQKGVSQPKSWAEASGKGSDLNENEYQRNE